MTALPTLRSCCTVAMVGAALLSTGVRAEPEIEESIERYEIRGSTAKELKAEMKRWRDNRTLFGYTRWQVTWKYVFATREGQCALSSFDVSVDVKTTLPQWIDREDADAELVDRWERFMDAFEEHERGHKRLGMEAATAVERRLVLVEPQPSCDELDHVVDEAAREVIGAYRETERRFDENTRHGKTEGARF
jgi:predicted secreted Zn-dependent protease